MSVDKRGRKSIRDGCTLITEDEDEDENETEMLRKMVDKVE